MDKTVSLHNEKRNFLAMMMEGAFFVFGLAFLNPDGVVAVFIDTFTGRMELVGLAVAIRLMFGMAPRLLIGPYVPFIKNLKRFVILLMAPTRSAPLWVALLLITVPDSDLAFLIFILAYGTLWFAHSLVLVGWLDIFGRVISGHNRGRIQGYQQVLGGIGGIGAGLIIKWLLDNEALTQSMAFGIIFALAGGICTLSIIPMFFVIDEERPEPAERISYRVYFHNLKELFLRKADYRLMVKSMATNRIAILANPFIILSAKHVLGVEGAVISTIIFIQIIGGLSGGLIWGTVSHRLGNRKVILYTSVTTTICLTTVLAALLTGGEAGTALIIAAAFLGGVNNLSWIGHLNYAIDIGAPDEKTNLAILNGIFTIPVSIMGLFIGGIAEHAGFMITFIFAGAVSLVGWYYSRMLPEPGK